MYLFGSNLLKNKFANLALQLIFGLGKIHSNLIVKKLGFCLNFKVKNLTKKQIFKLVKVIQSLNIFIAFDLHKFRLSIFKKLLKIKYIKSLSRSNGLPIRGQRTHTNAKTAKKFKF
jgi:small subunit ribosomal protein S13